MKIENRYEEGSMPYQLLEAGEEIGAGAATMDPVSDALDRLTTALYRIGAAVAYRMDDAGLYHLSENVEGLKYAVSEIGDAIASQSKPANPPIPQPTASETKPPQRAKSGKGRR